MSIIEDLEELTGNMGAAGTAADGLLGVISRLDNTVTKLASTLEDVGKSMKSAEAPTVSTGKSASGASAAFDSLAESGKSVLDSFVPTEGVLGAVSQALKAMGPEGEAVAIILGIVVTVVTALASELWSLTQAAVAISQEKDALAETFKALSDGAQSGLELVDSLSEVAASLPQAEGKVLAWGKALMAAGKQGDALEQSVRAVAAANAIMGESGSAAAQTLVKRFEMMAASGQKVKLDRRILSQLAEAGISAKTLGDALGVPADKLGSMSLDAAKLGDAMEKALIQKGAGALEKMSLTWKSISGKLDDAWGDLFEDLGTYVQPLMKEIRDFFAEFSAGTTLQGAAKSAVTSFFSTVFAWATKAAHAVHVGFLAMQIAALQVYIALAPLVRILRAIYTNADVLRGLKVIAALLIAPFALVAIVLGSIVAGLVIIGTAISYVGGLIVGAASWIVGAVVGLGMKISAAIAGLAAEGGNGARNFVNGLVNGIKSGVGAVAEAVKGLAAGAVSAFTSALGIKSPSRVMKAHGKQLPAGAAEGIDEGADEAQGAMEEMLEPPKAKPRGAMSIKSGDKIYNIYFQGSARDFPSFREQAMKFFQEEASAGPDPEPA